jgi:low affinity Fe/Cu permease
MTFAQITDKIAHAAGHPWAVGGSVVLVLVWALVGPHYGWSEEHQLFINTATTIITFWLVFVIQATQNRDTLALHAKMDELIRANAEARNDFIGIDHKAAEEVEQMRHDG